MLNCADECALCVMVWHDLRRTLYSHSQVAVIVLEDVDCQLQSLIPRVVRLRDDIDSRVSTGK